MMTQETSIVSVPVYRREDDGTLSPVGEIAPMVYESGMGVVVRLLGSVAYRLEEVQAWLAGGAVCAYRGFAHYTCLFVQVDDVHRAVATLLERWHGETSAA